MSIIFQENNAKFTKISNALIIDQSLSSGAKVLYCYLRSKPNNWKVVNADIIKTLKFSQETVAKYFKELIASGWISRKREINEKNQYSGGYEYIIKETPIKEETPNKDFSLIRETSADINKTKTTNKTDMINKTETTIVPKKKTPQALMCDYFKARYKANTGFDYLDKTQDYTLLSRLIKSYGMEQVKQKIDWLEAGCVNHVFWFARENGVNSFTIGKLYNQWNEILPQLTDKQRKEMEQQKEDEELRRRVMANVRDAQSAKR